MKRTFRVTPKARITASTDTEWWDKYYDRYTVDELVRSYGLYENEIEEGQADTMPGYENYKHVAWLIAKPEYKEFLEDVGEDWVELVNSNGWVVPVVIVGDRVYSVDEHDMDPQAKIYDISFYNNANDDFRADSIYLQAKDETEARMLANRIADEWAYDPEKIDIDEAYRSASWFYKQRHEFVDVIPYVRGDA